MKEDGGIERFAENDCADCQDKMQDSVEERRPQDVHDGRRNTDLVTIADEEKENGAVYERPDQKEDYKKLVSENIFEHFYSYLC